MFLLTLLAGVFPAIHRPVRAGRFAREEGASHRRISQPSTGWRVQPGPVCAGGGRNVSTVQLLQFHIYIHISQIFKHMSVPLY